MSNQRQLNAELKVFRPRTFAFARTQNRWAVDIDDVAQEVLIKLAKPENLLAAKDTKWLFVVIRNAIHDMARKERLSIKDNDEINQWSSSAVTDRAFDYEARVAEAADLAEPDLLPGIEKVLLGLTKPLREVLVLFVEGYSYSAIAALTGASIGTVRSRIHYARKYASKELAHFR